MRPYNKHFSKFMLICLFVVCSFSCFISCSSDKYTKIQVIFDTDANNELDDQHALAYLLFNKQSFDVLGVTINSTYNGGEVQSHYNDYH